MTDERLYYVKVHFADGGGAEDVDVYGPFERAAADSAAERIRETTLVLPVFVTVAVDLVIPPRSLEEWLNELESEELE